MPGRGAGRRLALPEPLLLALAGSRRAPALAVYFLFQIPEVLLWAKEQNEEKSPNLTQFTEHFNNMSYWYGPRRRARLMAALGRAPVAAGGAPLPLSSF